MTEPVTREEIERARSLAGMLDVEARATLTEFGEAERLLREIGRVGPHWRAILSAAEASLSHPAALERARTEGAEAGLERAARWHDEQAAALRALNETPLFKGRWRDLLVIAKQAIARHESNAKSIRALGPRPSPEAPAAPGHTDLMVAPETLDEFMAANPLPPELKGDAS